MSFKPYYKWITFNTYINTAKDKQNKGVLNLIINGLPSIQEVDNIAKFIKSEVVLNLIINGLPSIQK